MSVHVDEVQTRVVPTQPAGGNETASAQPRPGAAADAWATQARLAHRDDCRTAARGFDD
jgi:hypothetical protein